MDQNMGQFVFIGGMILVMYFFMIRPQQIKKKELKKFSEDVKTGDKIVTVGGIHGKIMSLTKETVTIEIDRGTKLTIDRGSISLEMSKKVQEATA